MLIVIGIFPAITLICMDLSNPSDEKGCITQDTMHKPLDIYYSVAKFYIIYTIAPLGINFLEFLRRDFPHFPSLPGSQNCQYHHLGSNIVKTLPLQPIAHSGSCYTPLVQLP